MNSDKLRVLLDKVKLTAIEAGKAIVPIAAEIGDVTVKQDGSPLTRADMASHNIIAASLDSIEPSFPVLSEEGELDKIKFDDGETFWCVDPLDGTKEFLKGLSEYTVNIALIEKHIPILGVVYVPQQNVLFYAAKGLGAWKVKNSIESVRINANNCEYPKTAVVSRSHLSQETESFLKRLNISKVIKHGSSIKICAVAEGKADIYPRHGPTCLWDTAAGYAVAVEAGCNIVDLQTKPLVYDPKTNIKHNGFIVYPKSLASRVTNNQ